MDEWHKSPGEPNSAWIGIALSFGVAFGFIGAIAVALLKHAGWL